MIIEYFVFKQKRTFLIKYFHTQKEFIIIFAAHNFNYQMFRFLIPQKKNMLLYIDRNRSLGAQVRRMKCFSKRIKNFETEKDLQIILR